MNRLRQLQKATSVPIKRFGDEEGMEAETGTEDNDHLPKPFQPLRTGPKLLLADREENPIVYFDVESLGGGVARGGGRTKPRELGRIHFELRNDLVPVACANFLTLITGKMGFGRDGVNYSYKGTRVHRIVKSVLFEAGDLLDQHGNCSRSIYNQGGLFRDENFILTHAGPGCLSMCNRGPDTNGSLFQVCFTANPDLDGKYVVFGCVASDEGYETLQKINMFGSDSGRPREEIRIYDCGIAYPFPKSVDEEDINDGRSIGSKGTVNTSLDSKGRPKKAKKLKPK